jgi:hypothetical protein
MHQRTTFNMIGPRPPVNMINQQLVRERLGILGFLDPAFILKSDETVTVTVDSNVYSVSSNLEFKSFKTSVDNKTITLPTENYGIQQILINMELSNDLPAFGEIDEYTVNQRVIDLGTNSYDGRTSYIKYLTIK